MPTRAEKIAQLENRLVDLQEANRKRESQLLAKKRLLEGLERTRDRKRRTRRLILIGSVVEKDLDLPNSALLKRVDRALEKKQDRALFDLPPRSVPDQAPPSAPLAGWTPAKITDGVWGARFQGDTHTLPSKLEGLIISVTSKSGKSWDATITEVVERVPDRLLVRSRRLDQ